MQQAETESICVLWCKLGNYLVGGEEMAKKLRNLYLQKVSSWLKKMYLEIETTKPTVV